MPLSPASVVDAPAQTRDAGAPEPESQAWLDTHFEHEAGWWNDLYAWGDVFSVIMQERAILVRDWVDKLGLPHGAHILEVGCGTGLTALTLAQRGYLVDATDRVPGMLDRARRNAAEMGISSGVRLSMVDAHLLSFRDASFPVVIAVGLIPWLKEPTTALREMARVVKPGGHLILVNSNSIRLPYLLDPLYNPAPGLKQAKSALNWVYQRLRPGARQRLPVVLRRSGEFDQLIAQAGLEKLSSTTIGFGPFTFMGVKLLRDEMGVRLHHRLQELAEHRTPWLRSLAAEYIVLARRRL